MKKMLVLLAAAAACSLFAQEAKQEQEINLIPNGNFEKVNKIAKASDKYIMSRIKMGWDFGVGPVAKVPANWVPNSATGKVKLRIVTVGDDGENKENVAEGKNSLHMEGQAFHLYNAQYLKPGKYKFSFKHKGSGRITLGFYCYKKDPKTGRGIHVTSRAPMTTMAKPQWQTFTMEMEIGKWAPGISTCTMALTGNKVNVYVDDIKVVEVK